MRGIGASTSVGSGLPASGLSPGGTHAWYRPHRPVTLQSQPKQTSVLSERMHLGMTTEPSVQPHRSAGAGPQEFYCTVGAFVGTQEDHCPADVRPAARPGRFWTAGLVPNVLRAPVVVPHEDDPAQDASIRTGTSVGIPGVRPPHLLGSLGGDQVAIEVDGPGASPPRANPRRQQRAFDRFRR